jgi:hypothetical protein
VNAQYYTSFLQCHICCAVRVTDAELTEYGIILYEDTAHSADTVKHFLSLWVELLLVQHPPYSPSLSPPDHDLITKLKQLLHEDQFANFNSSLAQHSTDEHVRRCQCYSPLFPSLAVNHGQPYKLLLRFLPVCTNSLYCIHCSMFTLYATIKQ